RKALERKLPPTVREAAALELAEVLVKRTEFADALALLDAHRLELGPPPEVAECRAECLCGLGRHGEAKQILEQLPTSQSSAPAPTRPRAPGRARRPGGSAKKAPPDPPQGPPLPLPARPRLREAGPPLGGGRAVPPVGTVATTPEGDERAEPTGGGAADGRRG